MTQPIFDIKQTKSTGDTFAEFEISPLEQGYGNTLGVSLRRVLLSSLPGAAITTTKLASVKHQFTTLKGMKEDVVELVLNLKKVRLTYTGDKPAKASITVKGPKTVTAGDIQVDPTVTIVNPDLVIATLNKDAKLDAKLTIETGNGYSLAEERATGEIGLIPMDASFSPVVKVNYRVEETRVGRVTNYDKLILEIWTDGTTSPKDAVVSAAKILVAYFTQVVNPKKVESKADKSDDSLGNMGKLSVEEIELPTRVANALVKSGYETIEDLVKADKSELEKVRNLGGKSVKIIEAALGEKGIKMEG